MIRNITNVCVCVCMCVCVSIIRWIQHYIEGSIKRENGAVIHSELYYSGILEVAYSLLIEKVARPLNVGQKTHKIAYYCSK